MTKILLFLHGQQFAPSFLTRPSCLLPRPICQHILVPSVGRILNSALEFLTRLTGCYFSILPRMCRGWQGWLGLLLDSIGSLDLGKMSWCMYVCMYGPKASKVTHLIPSLLDQPRITKMNPSEPKWTQVNPSEPNWTQVNPSESKGTKVNPSEPKWTKVSEFR